MITILADHNIEGQALILLGTLSSGGWLELLSLKVVTFSDVGLSFKTSDREVWRFAQDNNMILLTNNRNMKGTDSLEQTIRDENSLVSLPILTIGSLDHMDQKDYRDKCAARLLEVIVDLENYRGTGRVFIP